MPSSLNRALWTCGKSGFKQTFETRADPCYTGPGILKLSGSAKWPLPVWRVVEIRTVLADKRCGPELRSVARAAVGPGSGSVVVGALSPGRASRRSSKALTYVVELSTPEDAFLQRWTEL